MHQLSMVQALHLWSQLERAYYNDNSFGGDTAEIYLYLLMPAEPAVSRLKHEGRLADALQEAIKGEGCVSMSAQIALDAYQAANRALHSILTHFAEAREVGIEIDGVPLADWDPLDPLSIHRVHVKVIREAGAEDEPT